MKQLKIKVYSDFICPWCYVGKMRLDRIRKELQDEIQIEVETKAYLLYPHIPVGGVPKSTFAKKTKPGMGRSLRAEAETENIKINYKLIDKIPNSLEAHRLITLIPDTELQFQLSKDIFHAYFQEGENIEDKMVLEKLAANKEVPHSIIDTFSQTDNGSKELEEEIKDANDKFISLVPTIELTPALNILGLQSGNVWKNYFRRATKMSNS